ncbi:MAG TPA: hypothetical protein VMP67_02885 [Candidatus Limnocylindria bacterium]|nr:hypothetical protein [Candidatus Limnocylindria bacterium]
MRATGWRGLFGPPSLVISTALVIAAVVPAALAAEPLRPPPVLAQPCPAAGLVAGGLAAARLSNSDARVRSEAVLNSRGEQTGRRLTLALSAATSAAISLPAESFAAGPFGDLLVYGWHGPRAGSEVRVVDLASGCDERLAKPAGVVRSAVLDPSGAAMYVHAVTEGERRDAGVVRYDLTSGEHSRAVDPLPVSERFGPTFATSLVWSTDGRELAVQSCGFSLCRTRVLDTLSGALQTFDDEPHGALLGLDGASLYARDTCHWEPCDVLAIERLTGKSRVLVEEAYEAQLTTDSHGFRLTYQTSAGSTELRP